MGLFAVVTHKPCYYSLLISSWCIIIYTSDQGPPGRADSSGNQAKFLHTHLKERKEKKIFFVNIKTTVTPVGAKKCFSLEALTWSTHDRIILEDNNYVRKEKKPSYTFCLFANWIEEIGPYDVNFGSTRQLQITFHNSCKHSYSNTAVLWENIQSHEYLGQTCKGKYWLVSKLCRSWELHK